MNDNSDTLIGISFLGGIVCATICYFISERKGASTFIWILVGFVVGPLGILGALLIPSSAAAKERQAMKGGTMMRCSKCAELIRSEATMCKHCHSEVTPAAGPKPWRKV